MNRIELKLQTFMAVAVQISVLSTCDRKAVGAVFVRDGRCISWGFNGAPEGLPHCSENHHGWNSNTDIEVMGCRNATHAEANGLAFAARQGISTDKSTLFVTVSPCEVCSRLLIASGVKTIYYQEEYRDTRGLELIREAGGTALRLQRDHGGGTSS